MHSLRGLKVGIKDGHILKAKGKGLDQPFHHGTCFVALAVGAAQHLQSFP